MKYHGSTANDKELYKKRNEIKRFFRRIKAFRAVFTHYDKLDVILVRDGACGGEKQFSIFFEKRILAQPQRSAKLARRFLNLKISC